MRRLHELDQLFVAFDQGLRTLFATPRAIRERPQPAQADGEMNAAERRASAALMRLNHVGEVCAQALYSAQALTTRDAGLRQHLEHAAQEEEDHLQWTSERIAELGGRTSLLNPLWYLGSLTIGVAAGKFGDRWNLGFLAETERQVEGHLEDHKGRLPPQDRRSWEILEQMKTDEIRHAHMAVNHGAAELPAPVRGAMKLSSKLMTTASYYV